MENEKQFLKKFLKSDSDFIQLYNKNKKQLKKQKITFNKIIDIILIDIFENLKSYLLDKKYIDFSWVCYNDYIFNLDFIYTSYKLFINEAIYC